MMYLDLAELPELFDRYLLWSARGPAVAWFRRSDYHGPSDIPLDVCVRRTVADQLGFAPEGPVRLLTHLRYAGHCFNPVSFYYCYGRDGECLEAILAEITNTPWRERHCYALNCRAQAGRTGRAYRFEFPKAFHVSPFMPMEVRYDWRFHAPGDRLTVHMGDRIDGRKVFDATLDLTAHPVSRGMLARVLTCYPLMTLKVVSLIHWQALRLYLKRAPFYVHPKYRQADGASGG
jgi:DUF1365 family protein